MVLKQAKVPPSWFKLPPQVRLADSCARAEEELRRLKESLRERQLRRSAPGLMGPPCGASAGSARRCCRLPWNRYGRLSPMRPLRKRKFG